MNTTKTMTGGGFHGHRPAALLVHDILDDVELERPVSAAAFTAARAALAAERLAPLDRAAVGNNLDAAEGYVVEAPGYCGYFPGAGRWHLRQALARLGNPKRA